MNLELQDVSNRIDEQFEFQACSWKSIIYLILSFFV